MKKTISIILSLMMLVFAIPYSIPDVYAETSGLYTYSISDGEAKITHVDDSISGDITIPSTLGGCPVTAIGSWAFRDCTLLTGVTITDSVTSIGSEAFRGCTALKDITIGSNVEDIESTSFYETGYYDDASNWQDGVLYIDDYLLCAKVYNTPVAYQIKAGTRIIACCAFGSCSFTSIIIPDSVTAIGDNAFYACKSLTSISIPDSVTSIGVWAFTECESLTEVKLSNSIDSIGELTFAGCTSLESITVPDSVTEIGFRSFCDCISLTSLSIGNGVKSIADRAFQTCKSVTSIIIPDSVETIGARAFDDCESLVSIRFGNGVKSIDEKAFGYYLSDKTYKLEKIELLTVYGYKGTVIEEYANDNGFEFVALDDQTVLFYGSIDGNYEITATDSLIILQASILARDLTSGQIVLVDVDGDKNITATDALLVLQKSIKLIDKFPVERQ